MVGFPSDYSILVSPHINKRHTHIYISVLLIRLTHRMAGFSMCVSEVTSKLTIEPALGLSNPSNVVYTEHNTQNIDNFIVHDAEDEVSDGFSVRSILQIDATDDRRNVFKNTGFNKCHEGERFYCPHCNVRYTKVKYLKTHMKHCGQTFHCEYCERDYKQKRTWVLHMRTKHQREWIRKPFVEEAEEEEVEAAGFEIDEEHRSNNEHRMEEPFCS